LRLAAEFGRPGQVTPSTRSHSLSTLDTKGSIMTMRTRGRWTSLLVAAVGFASTALGADAPGIADLAPPNTLLLFGTDDWTKMVNGFEHSPLGGMKSDPDFVALWKAIWNQPEQTDRPGTTLSIDRLLPLKEILKDAGIDPQDLPLPHGGVGVAVYT